MVAVDGLVGFVSGLCASRKWTGDAVRGIGPWRDTGIEIRGPAVADIERAFAQMWAETGMPIPEGELLDAGMDAAAGALRISNTVGAAITNRRIPGPAEAGLMTGVGMALLAFAALALAWPLLVAFPLAALGAWIAVAFLVKAFKLRAEDGKVAGSTNAGPD
jgi:hypothetical protein